MNGTLGDSTFRAGANDQVGSDHYHLTSRIDPFKSPVISAVNAIEKRHKISLRLEFCRVWTDKERSNKLFSETFLF